MVFKKTELIIPTIGNMVKLGHISSFFLLLFVAGFLLVTHTSQSQARPNPKYASVVMDAQTGQILRARNAEKSLHPASLTKIMTLFLTFEALERGELRRHQMLRVSRKAASQPPSNVKLKKGDLISVKDAIYALLTKSANDVAVVVAEAIAGSESRFAVMMTQRAKSLGMKRTVFRNASGLHHPRQISTAKDMAILSRSMMQYFPQYYSLFSTTHFTYKGTTYRNHNKLMKSYQGMDGLKTGYIRASGFNLAASAVRENHRLIGVVFGGRTGNSRNRHLKSILDETFRRLGKNKLVVAGLDRIPPVPEAKPTEFRGQAFALAQPSTKKRPLERLGKIKVAKNIDNDTVAKDTSWSIQVGAFASRVASDQAIASAMTTLNQKLPHSARPVIVPLRTDEGLVFRARLINMDAKTAHGACSVLKDCVVVSSN